MPEPPPRPLPSRSPADRVRDVLAGALDRVRWFGVARAVGVALCVLAAGLGSFWLVRTPPPPIEASLPMATDVPGTLDTATGASTSSAAIGGEADGAVSPATVADGAAPGSGDGAVPPTAPAEILVHVAGAVALPGVYRLPAGARVVDALAAAGGPANDADTDAVNLAEELHDGDRILVPSVADAVVVPPGVSGSGSAGEAVPAGTPAGPVDLNRADEAALDALPGVGPATAAAIVSYREEHGPFASVDDLADVRGIGPAKLEALRGLVTV